MQLHAKSKPPKRKPAKSSGADYSYHLLALYLICVLSATTWYIWPRDGAEKDTRRKLQKLTTQNPDAEVFDLGFSEKKK